MDISYICMTLSAVLKRCRSLSETSRDAVYASMGVSQIVEVLSREIESLERRTRPRCAELKLLFAPTGALQDTSIANGWAEEYLLLAARFDTLIAEYGEPIAEADRPNE